MGALRQIRRKLTAAAVIGAARLAPMFPKFGINGLERVVATGGRITPKLAAIVRRNMISAGVYSPEVFAKYFEHSARHLTNGLRVLKWKNKRQNVIDLANQDVTFDSTLDIAKEQLSKYTGGMIAPAHCINYLVSLVRINQDIPISIYLRWSKDPRRVELKKQWCEAAGLDAIVEPPNLTNPAARAEICVEAMHAGKTLAITPDLVQKKDEGVGVRWLDRNIYLPTGPASLAMLAEVPILPLFASYRDRQQVLSFSEPITVERLSRTEGGRHESVRRAMQSWTDGFSSFIRDCPEGWYLWADNRWTRVLSGDQRYVDCVESAASNSQGGLNAVPEGRA